MRQIKQSIKEGDWIVFSSLYEPSKEYMGYILQANALQIIVKQINKENTRKIYTQDGLHRKLDLELDNNMIDSMIDLALDIKDEKWFRELCEMRGWLWKLKHKHVDTYGEEVLCDIYGVDPSLLNNLEFMTDLGKFAIAKSGASYEGMLQKRFVPQGLTLLFLLSESHLTFHCSPEHEGYAAINCFTCSRDCDPDKAIDFIIEKLKPDRNRVYRHKIIRGVE